MTIENTLLNLRKSKHYIREEIASNLNVTRNEITKWEKNYNIPNIDKLNTICKLYNINIEELLEEENVNIN